MAAKVFSVNSRPILAPGEPVEGQIDQEEQLAEAHARGVVQQERRARGATSEQAGLAEKQHGHGDEQGAREQRLRILEARMAHRGVGGGVRWRVHAYPARKRRAPREPAAACRQITLAMLAQT